MTRKGTVLLSCLFAAIGFVIQLAIVLAIGFGARPDFITPLAISVFGLFLAAIFFGAIFHAYFSYTSKNRSILLGSLIGWAALWSQVIVGSSVEFFKHAHESSAFEAYIFRPTFWVIFLGTIPSLVIGSIFGKVVWDKLHPNLP